jgi:hypothetical protein
VAQVLARQDLTARFTRPDEAIGGGFEQRNRLCFVVLNRGLAKDQGGPWVLDVAGAETAQPAARLAEIAVLSPDALEAQQVAVGPLLSGRPVAPGERRRGGLIGEDG